MIAELPRVPAAPNSLAHAVFGPPPLVEGEDADAYADLLARVSAVVKPADILEEIWVRDVVDLVWEALRLRRVKASLVQASLHTGIHAVLYPVLGYNRASKLSSGFAEREETAVEDVRELLASAGLDMDAVVAEALVARLDAVERIDHLITNAEMRRSVALREVERHRQGLGRALRQATEKVEEAEFEVIAPGSAA